MLRWSAVRPSRSPKRSLRKTEVSGNYPFLVGTDLRRRVRELGIRIGKIECGDRDSIADVHGVTVGQVGLVSGEGKLVPGKGPVRTGVTVILPHEGNVYEEKLRAGVHVQNGAGELTGALQVMEWGILETPIALTNTLNVGLVNDAIVEYMLEENTGIGDRDDVVLPIVGECDDSYLNDIRGRHVKREHVFQAIKRANREVAEGSTGSGTGMSALGFKAGIGTASRRLADSSGGHTIGVIVMANFGGDLCVDGVPVGRQIQARDIHQSAGRSIITVVATDAPLASSQLRRIAGRVPLALGRVGSASSNSSGDISIAFSTAERINTALVPITLTNRTVSSNALDELFRATIEATEEAILNSIFASETMKGRDDNISFGLPIEEVLEIMRRHGRL
jgi:D-aminopeptidase